jgi:cardiolipin synthase
VSREWFSGHRVSRKTLWLSVAGAVLATAIAAIVVYNLSTGEAQIEQKAERLYDIDDAQFLRVMSSLLGPPVTSGNRYRVLLNGDQIFPAMLAAIRGARKSITFETYIYWSGDIGREFADALSERARAGVPVHVLLDWVGSAKLDEASVERMRSAGVQIEKFHPPHWSNLGRLNNRTHRKLLVVDGRVGFTGGVGIAPKWTGNAQDPDHWRETHFQVEGPVVAQMQSVFLDNWIKTTGTVLHGAEYFPPLAPMGAGVAQMFSSSPTGGSESMQMMYLLSITAASRSIRISSAYFVPDDLSVRAMVDAMKRGVKLQIITPGTHTDSEVVRTASKATWGELLMAGAEIYEYQPTMYHCKVMIVDDVLVSTGSTNFDNRSFRLNDEANLNIYDAAFARQQVAIFERDRALSRRYTLEQWQARSWWDRTSERAVSLIESQL